MRRREGGREGERVREREADKERHRAADRERGRDRVTPNPTRAPPSQPHLNLMTVREPNTKFHCIQG